MMAFDVGPATTEDGGVRYRGVYYTGAGAAFATIGGFAGFVVGLRVRQPERGRGHTLGQPARDVLGSSDYFSADPLKEHSAAPKTSWLLVPGKPCERCNGKGVEPPPGISSLNRCNKEHQ